MKHVIKIGNYYLANDGMLTDCQRHAMRIDGALWQGQTDRPRLVSLRPHGSAPTSTASTDNANRLLDGRDADQVNAPDMPNDTAADDGVVVTVGAVTVRITINN